MRWVRIRYLILLHFPLSWCFQLAFGVCVASPTPPFGCYHQRLPNPNETMHHFTPANVWETQNCQRLFRRTRLMSNGSLPEPNIGLLLPGCNVCMIFFVRTRNGFAIQYFMNCVPLVPHIAEKLIFPILCFILNCFKKVRLVCCKSNFICWPGYFKKSLCTASGVWPGNTYHIRCRWLFI